MKNTHTVEEVFDLEGKTISTVAFVRDYVEFYFDGPVLRSISNPRIIVKNVEYRFPEQGSRDALCLVIGSRVSTVELREHDALVFATSNGCQVMIPLDVASLRGDEAMHFMPALGGLMQVW